MLWKTCLFCNYWPQVNKMCYCFSLVGSFILCLHFTIYFCSRAHCFSKWEAFPELVFHESPVSHNTLSRSYLAFHLIITATVKYSFYSSNRDNLRRGFLCAHLSFRYSWPVGAQIAHSVALLTHNNGVFYCVLRPNKLWRWIFLSISNHVFPTGFAFIIQS